QEGCKQNSELPSNRHIGRHPRALACRPSLGGESHPDPEFSAQPKTCNDPERNQVPISSRNGAKAGESCENKNGPSQHTDSPEMVAQCPEGESTCDSTEQGPGNERSRLGLGKT